MALELNSKKSKAKAKTTEEVNTTSQTQTMGEAQNQEAQNQNASVETQNQQGDNTPNNPNNNDGNSPEVKFGSARKDLSFIQPLGDPSNPDTTRVKLPSGEDSKKVTSTIVGYRFKVNKDMQIPDCGTNEGFKNDPMNYKDINWIDVKAGTTINLTPFETALLLSQPQFNGGCDGGEIPVSCVYQTKGLKTKSGQVATASAAAAVPRVSLRAANGSIKDSEIDDVLTFTKQVINGVTRKIRTIKPGYEKWSPLAATSVRKATGGRTGSDVDPTTVANKNAQAFLAFVRAKKSN